MASGEKSLDGKGQVPKGRVVTDSVHARFRTPSVYCLICDIEFDGSPGSIENHFTSSHPSTASCLYCKGKVFSYSKLSDCSEGRESRVEDIIFHKCRNAV